MPKQTRDEHNKDAEQFTSAQQCRERAGQVFERMKELRTLASDPKHTWSDENEAAWVDANAEYDAFQQRAGVLERVETIERANQVSTDDGGSDWENMPQRKRGGNSPQQRQAAAELRDLSLAAWFKRTNLTEAEQAACRATRVDPTSHELTIELSNTRQLRTMQKVYRTTHPSLAHERALSLVDTSAGATLRPDVFVNALEVNMLSYSGVLQACDIMRTANGNPMSWPTADDTSNEGVQIDENEDNEDQDPTFGAVMWYAYELSSKFIKVPRALYDDAAIDLAAVLGDMCGERLGRTFERKGTLGTGAGTFTGFLAAAAVGKTCAATNVITPDEALDLQHSVNPAYRIGAEFMCNDAVVLYLRKLKDTTNQYLWQPGLQAGVPDRLCGTMLRNNDMMTGTLAASAKVLAYGQFKKFKVRMVGGVTFRRLQERFAEKNQDAYIAFLRGDSNLLDAGTAPIKYMQMAAS